MTAIPIARTASGKTVSLPLQFANRHGLITGATGTGKTVTLQRLAEEFSRQGVPVFAADAKGDLSGIGAAGDGNSPTGARGKTLLDNWRPEKFPVQFWDLYGAHGLPIRTSVTDMGAQLLSSMLNLNDAQSGAIEIAFRKADSEQSWMLTLNDLRWQLNDMLEERETVCRQFGNVTASSISAIQRNILALEAQGGDRLFGEPAFDIADLMRLDGDGRGVVNLLHADKLLEAPKLYATFLLWLLTELFRRLPEAGDLDKPRLVFFFDEAHLLFTDAPKPLLQSIERLVRLVRSKGVGVYFVTQTPTDVPDSVLEQLGNRIQHALRAYTAKSLRKINAAADALRPNPAVNARAEITTLGIGEVLISLMEADNVPARVEKAKILPPAGQVGPISELERRVSIEATPLFARYSATMGEREAAHQFSNRVRLTRGLDPLPPPTGREWQEGDYLQFVPYHVGIEARRSVWGKLLSFVFYLAILAGSLSFLWHRLA